MKILFLDIETAPHLVYTWGLFNQTIPPAQVAKPSRVLCVGYQWMGGKPQCLSGSRMFKKVWQLLNEADAVVHYNGKRFDVPTLNRELVERGLAPPTAFAEIDLYQTVKQRFKFASNRLDFVCAQLGLGTKAKTRGMPMWIEAMGGGAAAMTEMMQYCKQDVMLLVLLYQALLPWIKQHPNYGISATKPTCRNCGSTNVKKDGVETRFVQQYQRYRCKDCGTPLRGRLTVSKPGPGVLV